MPGKKNFFINGSPGLRRKKQHQNKERTSGCSDSEKENPGNYGLRITPG
jgi:hypothetical protein